MENFSYLIIDMTREDLQNKFLKCAITLRAALIIYLFLTVEIAEGIFTPGKEYIFDYEAVSSSGVLVPSKAQSSWGFSGSLIVKAYDDEVLIQVRCC